MLFPKCWHQAMSLVHCNYSCNINNKDDRQLHYEQHMLSLQGNSGSLLVLFVLFSILNRSYERVHTSAVYLFIRLFGRLPQSVT